MTAVANILAGARVTAAMLQGIAPMAAFKGANQTITSNNTTFINDSALFLPLPSNSTWVYFGLLNLTGATLGSGDFKTQWTGPTGATLVSEIIGFTTSTGGVMNGNALRGFGGAPISCGVNGSNTTPAVLMGSVTIGSTAGTFQLQWCQNTSSATGTTVNTGSFLAAWQVA